uniref:Candidate secreted effector n=1 Tax=Meloidogyne incognita TaxID=6306 RepID=A0A914M362_MELIC
MWLLKILIFFLLINYAESGRKKLTDLEKWNNYVKRLGDVDSKNYSVDENGVYCKVCNIKFVTTYHNSGKKHQKKLREKGLLTNAVTIPDLNEINPENNPQNINQQNESNKTSENMAGQYRLGKQTLAEVRDVDPLAQIMEMYTDNEDDTDNDDVQITENSGIGKQTLVEVASSSHVRDVDPLANKNFINIQQQILKNIKFKQNVNVDGNQGGFHLSSLSKQQISDNIREEKINKLSVELRECVAKKKREFEQVIEENIYLKIIFLIFKSYRNDCE